MRALFKHCFGSVFSLVLFIWTLGEARHFTLTDDWDSSMLHITSNFTSKACHFKPAKYVLGLTLLLTHPIQWHKIYCKNCTADETESCSNEVLDGIKRQCQDMHWVKNVTTPYAQLSSILTNNSISQSNRYQIIRFWSHAWAWILNKNTATDISRLSMCS